MRRAVIAWLMATGLMVAPGCGPDGSTPELCDEACKLWDACTGQEGWYPYDVCYPECIEEGDWDRDYVDCLRSYSSCVQLESICG